MSWLDHGDRVWHTVQYVLADDGVEVVVVERHGLAVAFDEGHAVGQAAVVGLLAREVEDQAGEIQADDLHLREGLGERDGRVARAGSI